MPRRVHLITFGCQMNKLDAELVAQSLRRAGHAVVQNPEEADTVLLHTCAVRDQAENRVLSYVGLLKERRRREPDFRIGVLGCMAQRLGESLSRRSPEIDLVIGTRQFHRIAEWLEQAEAGPVVVTEEIPLAAGPELPAHDHAGGPQAYVAAMRGCNNFCSYCIVPYVRGREESRPPAAILAEVRRLVAGGAREVTLLGQSIERYGLDLSPAASLPALLEALAGVAGLRRLRFVTAHPRGVTPALFEAMRELPAVCEALHMPAQSGSDAMLRAMNRRYSRATYEARLAEGRRRVPGIAFASDFIVGFPGETEADFRATLELVERERFQQIFAFRYSPRPGTRAAALTDDVPREEKERRLQALLAAQERVNAERNAAAVGTEATVLVEGLSKQDESKLVGRTPQTQLVVFPAPAAAEGREALIGEEVRLRIVDQTPLTLFGERLAP